MKGWRKEWHVPASSMAKNTFNPIRAILENLDLEPNPDKEMIALSIGDPTVYGNLQPPEEVVEAIVQSVGSMKHNGYTASVGSLEARNAVAKYVSSSGVQIEAKDVVLCSGCSHALDLCISVIANPGQNILVPRPGFSIYKTLSYGLGIGVKYYDLLAHSNWEVDLRHLESQIDSQTAAIVVNNPSNPCGSVFSRKHLQEILKIAAKHYLPIIADEIYDYFVFKGQTFHPIASLTREVPILTCGGLTKRYLIPGWRSGWITIHDSNNVLSKEIRSGLLQLSQRIIGCSSLIQGALPAILKNTPADFFAETIHCVEANAELIYDRLSKIPGLHPIMPQGAMYIMVGIDMDSFPNFNTDLHLVEALVAEESVFCLPGQVFELPNYVRLVLTLPQPLMVEACDRIDAFCQRHYRKSIELPLPEVMRKDELVNGSAIKRLTLLNEDLESGFFEDCDNGEELLTS